MSISGMMRTSVSGMAAQSNRLASVGDNIANASTHGYKRSFVEFSTMVLESGKGSYQPGSVDTQIRYGISQQGGFDYTTSKTDLAVSGNGFLLVSSGTGNNDASYLTRAGSFVKDQDGNLVNAGGYYLLGYPLTAGQTPTVSANGTTGLQAVNVSSVSLEATPTTAGTFAFNLPEDAAVVPAGLRPSDNLVNSESSAKTSMVVVDNIGREVVLDVYYSKTGMGPPPTWEVTIFDSSTANPTTTFPYSSGPLRTAIMTFDGNGQFASVTPAGPAPNTIQLNVPNGSSLVIDVGGTTELADGFQPLSTNFNGNKPSAVEYVEFSSDGKLYAVYGSGARQAIYQIPLATVASPDNLTPEAGNVYSISATSGGLQLGFPGTGAFGDIRASQLEKSTVDTATELTTMIESQFAFTANSKVFQTGGELMDVLVNLKR